MWGMGTRVEWDFALELSGITPDDLPMALLADYLRQWAELIGVAHQPVFKGVIKGSASLRSQVHPLERTNTQVRLRNAANDDKVRPLLETLEGMLARDGLRRARIIDRDRHVLQVVVPTPAAPADTLVVTDAGEIDGRVYRLSGKDESTSVGLIEDGTGRTISVETNSDSLARQFAAHFKGAILRVRVHGTWTRHPDGRWEPKRLTADRFDVLDDAPLIDTLRALQDMPGNRWAGMTPEQADAAWRELRYGPQHTEEEAGT